MFSLMLILDVSHVDFVVNSLSLTLVDELYDDELYVVLLDADLVSHLVDVVVAYLNVFVVNLYVVVVNLFVVELYLFIVDCCHGALHSLLCLLLSC